MEEFIKLSNQVAIAAANNIDTTPELLTELARHKDIQVRQAVASNPNTPIDVLFQLAEEFPIEFIKNPILPLLHLENPAFYKTIPHEVILNILASEDAPEEWLIEFATSGYYDYLLLIVQNPQVSKKVLQLVTENQYCNDFIRELIEMHVNIAGEMPSGWQEYADNKLQNIHDIIASGLYNTAPLGCDSYNSGKGEYYQFTFWLLGIEPKLQLAQASEYIQETIARFSDTPPEYLRELLTLKIKIPTLIEVAKNKNTPVECLIELVNHNSRMVRETAMKNPSLPRSIVNSFFQERFLATHPHTEVEKLRELCTSKWSFIRVRVAKHPNLELSDLEKLARSPEWRIRVSVASHPCADIHILKHFTQDKSILVRRAVALNSQTPPDILEILSRDRHVHVRADVAKNPHTPSEIVRLLYQEQDRCILQNIALNPATSPELRAQLELQYIYSKSNYIYLWSRLFNGEYDYQGIEIKELPSQEQYDIAASAMTPIPQLLELIKIVPTDIYWEVVHNIWQQVVCNPDLSPDLLLQILNIRSVDIYAAVASHPHITNEICHKIANIQFRDLSGYRLRWLMLQNPHISLDFIENSLYDITSDVRQAALIKYKDKFANSEHQNIFLIAYNAAVCSQTPIEKLIELAKHKSVLIREAVAQNARFMEAYNYSEKARNCLEKLAKDKNKAVRLAVANNINTPIPILEILAKNYQYTPGIYTRYQRHHNLKEHKVFVIAVKKLIQIAPEIASKYLVQYIEPNGRTIDSIPFRLAIIQNFKLPKEYFFQKLKTLNLFTWYERYLIIQNPQTSTEILQILAKDGNRVVRAAAKARLNEKL
ncbi:MULTISPECIES: hypothetical protein [Calothrix]|uniref:Leucine rich repeat variant n=2 Tax=Calothrix TaxID=1186 RepID=A0ABR8ANS3_9CYAN|nr:MULTISPECIES: hypothetical protein [Calothrix]MBD2200272.1 hypothetical protein [Calothrix parietina FACHB-288]MBD2229258.1 hypothetical protein [Calothrix anomala FACHB-343]